MQSNILLSHLTNCELPYPGYRKHDMFLNNSTSRVSNSRCSPRHLLPKPIQCPHSQTSIRLDEATKSRLLQLYTALQPIVHPKQIQSHFTRLHITSSNASNVLDICSQLKTSNPTQPINLGDYVQQSWRVTAHTVESLEQVWTGRCSEKLQQNKPSACDINNEFYALNLAIKTSYSSAGQPTLSLIVTTMTEEAFETIKRHTQPCAPSHAFPTIPFVPEDSITSTLHRIRNADVQRILTQAAEGRSWYSTIQHNQSHSSKVSGTVSPPFKLELESGPINQEPSSPSSSVPHPALLQGQDPTFWRTAFTLLRTIPSEQIHRSSQLDTKRHQIPPHPQIQRYLQRSNQPPPQLKIQTGRRVEVWMQTQPTRQTGTGMPLPGLSTPLSRKRMREGEDDDDCGNDCDVEGNPSKRKSS